MATTSIEDLPLNSFHKKLAVYSSGAPFLDGYILSMIGIVLLQITDRLHLTPLEQGLIAASPQVGMFFGGFAAGWLTDKIGRKLLFTLDLGAMVVFAALQFWALDPWILITLRLMLGITIGADHPLATSLLAEFLPKKERGQILASLVTVWFVGAAIAYGVGDLILRFGGSDAWRWALASAAIPGAIFFLMRSGTPESPRWLQHKGRLDEANAVIHQVYGTEYSVDDMPELPEENKAAYSALFRAGYGKRVFFVSVFWMCVIIPQFAIYAFAPKILGMMGLVGNWASLGSVAITVMFVIGCMLASSGVSRLGRRRLLLHSFLWSGLALLILGIFPNSSGLVTLLLFGAYAVTSGGGQVLEYVYPNELFPTEIRGSAMGVATAFSRIGAAIGTYLVPFLLAWLGIGPTMLIAAGTAFLGLLVSWFMAPETHGMDLHHASSLNH